MGFSSRAGAGRRQTPVVHLAERRAFESYLRRGRTPDHEAALAEAAANLPLRGLGDQRPTTYYTWRTARDERVRASHAAHDGQVFAWGAPPPTGHPGQAPNCRCWAEPYYGSPLVADSGLPLQRRRRSVANGNMHWASVETLTRPDGSLAESRVVLGDGGRILSTFAGSRVVHDMQLPQSRRMRVEKRDGIQAIYGGSSKVPALRSAWTSDGPKVVVPRKRVAQLLAGPRTEFDEIELVEPFRVGGPLVDAALGAAAAAALLALYNALQVAPESLGAGSADVAAVAFRVWKDGRDDTPLLVGLAALTAAQVARSCRRLPQVQAWTTEAATELAPLRLVVGPQAWGTAVHKRIADTINALRVEFPHAYGSLSAELSLNEEGITRYGKAGSTRLDVLEEVHPGLVCVYDVKTGDSGLSQKRVAAIAGRVARYRPGATFFVIEVRPFE